jgi:molybdopterin adenylyltransferase
MSDSGEPISDKIEIVSVNVSDEKGTSKRSVSEIMLDERGVVGDAHAGPGLRQVSLLAIESIERFASEAGREFAPGEFAENVTVRGLDFRRISPLDRLRCGEALLEVTQLGKQCHGDTCAIFREVGKCVMPKEGFFCRVLHGGRLRPGDEFSYLPKILRINVITLSDRAASADYEDRSGPRIEELLNEFFQDKRWRTQIDRLLLPDEASLLRAELLKAREEEVDVVITTGGTGVGPRDITPDVAIEVCDKLIPGIMEHIRLKYGAEKPNALLSRGIAGVAGRTLIYTLPGSPRAVEEYLSEILKTLEHLIYMIHGSDIHGNPLREKK